jgi:hypothetical protein
VASYILGDEAVVRRCGADAKTSQNLLPFCVTSELVANKTHESTRQYAMAIKADYLLSTEHVEGRVTPPLGCLAKKLHPPLVPLNAQKSFSGRAIVRATRNACEIIYRLLYALSPLVIVSLLRSGSLRSMSSLLPTPYGNMEASQSTVG